MWSLARDWRLLKAFGLFAIFLFMPSPVASEGPLCFAPAATLRDCEAWVALYHGFMWDEAVDIAYDPETSDVYVTGTSASQSSFTNSDIVTLRLDEVTGESIWTSRYEGVNSGWDEPVSIAVHDGRVYVAGTSEQAGGNRGILLLALDTATGTTLWDAVWTGGLDSDIASEMAVDSAHDRILIPGASIGSTTGFDFVTLAFDAKTGDLAWQSRYDGPAHSSDIAVSLALGQNSGTVFVAGRSATFADQEGNTDWDFATIAYDLTNGALRWVSRYGLPESRIDFPTKIAYSGAADMVVVTGYGDQGTPPLDQADYLLVAYDGTVGTELWNTSLDGLSLVSDGFGDDRPSDLLVSSDGATVFLTGTSYSTDAFWYDAITAAFDAHGRLAWISRFGGPSDATGALFFQGGDYGRRLAMSPDENMVHVSGYTWAGSRGFDFFTESHEATTGVVLRSRQFDGAGGGDFAQGMAVAENGTLFVTGHVFRPGTGPDFVTVAYGP